MNKLSLQQERRRGRKRGKKTQGTVQLELWQAAFELENSNHRQNRNGSSPGPLSKQAEANQSKGDQSWQRKVQEEAEVI